MSDYLNNIVARSLSVAEVVQPRMPHLFEQTVTATPVEMEPVSTGESVAERRVELSVEQSSYSPTPTAQVSPTVATPFLEEFQPESPTVALPPTPFLPEPPMPVAEMVSKPAVPPAPNAPASRTKSVPARAQSTQQHRPINHNADRVTDTVVPSRVGPPQFEPSAPVPKSEPVTHRTISQAVPAALPQVNRAEPQLPPIRINIGRVDVRAIMPAAPPVVHSSPRPKPALSLESYLKQREEGKR